MLARNAELVFMHIYQNMSYGYDAVGNIKTLANAAAVPTSITKGGATSYSFGYDDLYQLTSSTGAFAKPGQATQKFTLAMSYDGIHNITHKTQTAFNLLSNGSTTPNVALSYDYAYAYAGGRPHAASQAGNHAFLYDLDGNQAGWNATDSYQNRRMVWDEDERLQSVTDNAGQPTTFKYDGDTNRVVKKGAGGETLYINPWYVAALGRNSKQIFAGTTRIATKLEISPTGEGYGPGAKNLKEVAQYFYHQDHLGSTGFATDATGETWVDEVSDDTRVPYRFTGQELDQETRLYYFGARYYDPRTSAWQNPDPFLGRYLNGAPARGVFEPSNLALLTYAHQNPVKLVDPDGKWAGVDDAVATVGGGLVGVAIQGGMDLYHGHVSSWKEYVASGVGGAAAGEAALYTGGFGSGAAGGLAYSLTKQALTEGKISASQTVVDTAVGALGGKAGQVVGEGLGSLAEKYGPQVREAITEKLGGKLCSFDASTLVTTKDGLKRIDQISVNELVLAKDEKTGETGWKQVQDRYTNNYKERVLLTLEAADGTREQIISNRIHPFFGLFAFFGGSRREVIRVPAARGCGF